MPRKKKSTQKKITLDQLKSYIEGAVEFNDEDWCPNKQQWDKIVDMIMNLKETPQSQNTQTPRVLHHNQPNNSQQQPIRSPMAETLDQMQTPVINEQGPRPPKIDMRKHVEYNMPIDEAAPASAPAPMAKNLLPEGKEKVYSSGKAHKTPNIDTSKKDYDSAFE